MNGELKTISHPVSAVLEISKLTDAESKSPRGGKALYFEKVKDSPFPVATNLFGSSRRICLALGVDNLEHLGDRIREIIHMSPPKDLRDMLGMLTTAFSVSRFFPRKSRAKVPPCQQVVLKGDDINLFDLPILHCWPQDAGRFITLPLVITRSLSTGKRNVGMYRMQVFDRQTTGMHWHIHKDGSNYFNEYRKAGKRMPVAVAIGADPATIYAATAPMPRNVDEMILAGFIRNAPVAMTRCLTCDLEVPAEAEFILEGYVDPDELRREGPFGDHTGYYSLADDYPVFHVTAITHRKSPVYCATLVGRPPMEDCYLAKATERLFLPLLQTVFPEITDYWLPWEGVFHNIVIVSIKKEYPRHAQKVISGLWGQGQMSFCKAIIVVDETVDPKDPDQVMQRLVDNFDLINRHHERPGHPGCPGSFLALCQFRKQDRDRPDRPHQRRAPSKSPPARFPARKIHRGCASFRHSGRLRRHLVASHPGRRCRPAQPDSGPEGSKGARAFRKLFCRTAAECRYPSAV